MGVAGEWGERVDGGRSAEVMVEGRPVAELEEGVVVSGGVGIAGVWRSTRGGGVWEWGRLRMLGLGTGSEEGGDGVAMGEAGMLGAMKDEVFWREVLEPVIC